MKYYTKREIEQKVKRELDLEADDFISPEEMTSYTQEAVDMAEGIVINLQEDFFLSKTEWMPITEEITLPEDIYSNKIRRFELRRGKDILKIKRNSQLKDRTNSYQIRYTIFNKLGSVPTAEIQGIHDFSEYRLFYIRNANKPVLDGDLIDIPECGIHFIGAYIKAKCYEKEIHPNTVQAKNEVEYYKNEMQKTLSNIVDDGSDLVESDYSFFEEFDDGYYY